mmetsp:Transcript_15790/g.19019  ORF Transcript_15790/g.19019 Transcript_15790/m.19019 type:complete len:769 (+) Transcript_15790:81-2387(+)
MKLYAVVLLGLLALSADFTSAARPGKGDARSYPKKPGQDHSPRNGRGNLRVDRLEMNEKELREPPSIVVTCYNGTIVNSTVIEGRHKEAKMEVRTTLLSMIPFNSTINCTAEMVHVDKPQSVSFTHSKDVESHKQFQSAWLEAAKGRAKKGTSKHGGDDSKHAGKMPHSPYYGDKKSKSYHSDVPRPEKGHGKFPRPGRPSKPDDGSRKPPPFSKETTDPLLELMGSMWEGEEPIIMQSDTEEAMMSQIHMWTSELFPGAEGAMDILDMMGGFMADFLQMLGLVGGPEPQTMHGGFPSTRREGQYDGEKHREQRDGQRGGQRRGNQGHKWLHQAFVDLGHVMANFSSSGDIGEDFIIMTRSLNMGQKQLQGINNKLESLFSQMFPEDAEYLTEDDWDEVLGGEWLQEEWDEDMWEREMEGKAVSPEAKKTREMVMRADAMEGQADELYNFAKMVFESVDATPPGAIVQSLGISRTDAEVLAQRYLTEADMLAAAAKEMWTDLNLKREMGKKHAMGKKWKGEGHDGHKGDYKGEHGDMMGGMGEKGRMMASLLGEMSAQAYGNERRAHDQEKIYRMKECKNKKSFKPVEAADTEDGYVLLGSDDGSIRVVLVFEESEYMSDEDFLDEKKEKDGCHRGSKWNQLIYSASGLGIIFTLLGICFCKRRCFERQQRNLNAIPPPVRRPVEDGDTAATVLDKVGEQLGAGDKAQVAISATEMTAVVEQPGGSIALAQHSSPMYITTVVATAPTHMDTRENPAAAANRPLSPPSA